MRLDRNGLPLGEDFLVTTVKYLVNKDTEHENKIAALLSFCDLNFKTYWKYCYRPNCYWAYGELYVPINNLGFVSDDIKKEIEETIKYIFPSNVDFDLYNIAIIPKLEESYENWRIDILEKILGQGINNQASFTTTKVPMCEYKYMKFRSKTERKLAPYFENSKILFFPLPLAVCGNEHREPDFLVCKKGKWAILEIVDDIYHPSVEKEAYRTRWFQDHNIQIRSYEANKCYEKPEEIVNEFIQWIDDFK